MSGSGEEEMTSESGDTVEREAGPAEDIELADDMVGRAAGDEVVQLAVGENSELAGAEEQASEAVDEAEDVEASDLDTGMSVSAKRATAGDTMTFSLRVSDDSGGSVHGYVALRNVETGQERSVNVNNAVWHPGSSAPDGSYVPGYFTYGDVATASLEVTDGFDPGAWAATRVYLSDANGHSVYYYDPAFAPSSGGDPTADLSALSFEVYGTSGDSEAPALGAVSVNVQRVAAGGNVTMTLKTEGHDVTEASIVYRTPQSGDSVPVPLSAKSEGVMAGSMAITPDTELGTWEAKAIEWTNSKGEERTVTNTALSGANPQDAGIMLLATGDEQDVLAGDSADLSGLTFEVVRPEEPNPTPEEPNPPVGPVDPSEPSYPSEPSVPEQPSNPVEPPAHPEQSVTPPVPAKPTPAPAKPAQPVIAQTGDETFSIAPVMMAGGITLLAAVAFFAIGRRRVRQ